MVINDVFEFKNKTLKARLVLIHSFARFPIKKCVLLPYSIFC